MSPLFVYLPLVATFCLIVAFGVHRWRLLGAQEDVQKRVGVRPPQERRWARTDVVLERVPGLGAVARRARFAQLPLGITDLVILAAILAYLVHEVLEILLGPTAALPLTLVFVPWALWLVVDMLARRRRDRIVHQVPDVVRLLAGGARAGLSLTGSLTQTANEVGAPIAAELRYLVASIEYGVDLADALAEFGGRVQSRDLDIVVSVIAIQQRTGGDLIALLTRLAVGLETNRRARREVKQITFSLRVQAYLGVFLGLLGLVLVNQITAGGVERALQMPVAAAIMAAAGLVLIATVPIIRRIVRLPS